MEDLSSSLKDLYRKTLDSLGQQRYYDVFVLMFERTSRIQRLIYGNLLSSQDVSVILADTLELEAAIQESIVKVEEELSNFHRSSYARVQYMLSQALSPPPIQLSTERE